MSTVHQFPVQRNQPPAAPEEVADALGVAIDAAVGADASFEARDAAALALTNEATRLFLERELLAIADGHGTHVEGDGVIYQRHEPGIVRYFTLCGAAVDRPRNGRAQWPDAGPSGPRRGPGGADDPGARLPGLPWATRRISCGSRSTAGSRATKTSTTQCACRRTRRFV